MAFRGVTFSGQNVTPKNDGALYNAHYGDGIIEGCSMAISGDELVVQSGHIIACGRVCQVDGATPVDLSGRTLQTGYIQVILNYDISQGEGQQWFTTFVESATTTFPALTQEDINTPTGTIYQLELAIVQISGGNLTNLTRTLSTSFLTGGALTLQNPSGSSAQGGFAVIGMGDADNPTLDFIQYLQSITETYNLLLRKNGGSVAGIQMNVNDQMLFFANQHNFRFQPNGIGNTLNEVQINTDGFLEGTKFKGGGITNGIYLQVGNLVWVQLRRNIPSAPVSGWTTVDTYSTLPTPFQTTYAPCVFNTGDYGINTYGQLRINTNKSIQIAPKDAITTTRVLIANFCYMTTE